MSSEVWIPPGAKYLEIFSGNALDCEILDPISALVSKAIKAPEKNRILVREALNVYGETLEAKIKEHGGNIEDFKRKQKLTL